VAAQALPLGLQLQPALVDDALVHLGEREARLQSRTHVIADQMDMRLDRDRLARRAGEVRGHARGHDEVRVEGDHDEVAARRGEPRSLGVQRLQRGQVLVHERRDHEVVGARLEPGVGDVRLDQPLVQAALTRHLQHLRREVDAVDRPDAVAAQPGGRPAGAAAEVGNPADVLPHGLRELVEQRDVHLVLNGFLVGGNPLAVARAHVDRAVAAAVEVGEVGHLRRTPRPAARARRGRSAA
jgi:hypothetical protein